MSIITKVDEAALEAGAGHDQAPPHPGAEFWSYFRVSKGAVAGLLVIGLIILVAIFAGTLAPHLPIEQYDGAFPVPPAWAEGGTIRFVLGTDAGWSAATWR